jgi:hypothetical protein
VLDVPASVHARMARRTRGNQKKIKHAQANELK